MKSYTDLEQSKKLEEILPIESADMCYLCQGMDDSGKIYYSLDCDEGYDEDIDENDIPCWSLAALLGVLPNANILVKTLNSEYYCLAKDVMTKHYDNPVDACCELILKLHELNLL